MNVLNGLCLSEHGDDNELHVQRFNLKDMLSLLPAKRKRKSDKMELTKVFKKAKLLIGARSKFWGVVRVRGQG